jgi:hypothetical protein
VTVVADGGAGAGGAVTRGFSTAAVGGTAAGRGADVGDSVGGGNIVAAGGGAGAGGGEIDARPDGTGAGTGVIPAGSGGSGAGTGDFAVSGGGSGAGTRTTPVDTEAGAGVGAAETPVGGVRSSICFRVAASAISAASVRRVSRATSSPSAGMSRAWSWEVRLATPRLVAS